jgi:hypothetical protein
MDMQHHMTSFNICCPVCGLAQIYLSIFSWLMRMSIPLYIGLAIDVIWASSVISMIDAQFQDVDHSTGFWYTIDHIYILVVIKFAKERYV